MHAPQFQLDSGPCAARYREQGEFLVVPACVGGTTLDAMISEANAMRRAVNRNYVPGIKKGGSVSHFDLSLHAPAIAGLYRAAEFIDRLSEITGRRLMTCPDRDPHACALYYYTEPGDHIGFHYDTSFYRGERFTVLVGLIERSQCRLMCELHRNDRSRPTESVSVQTLPGTLVLFNGDTLWHAVTPSAAGDDRVVLSMEYVTDRSMGPLNRIVSNVKDAVAYFGIRSLLHRAR